MGDTMEFEWQDVTESGDVSQDLRSIKLHDTNPQWGQPTTKSSIAGLADLDAYKDVFSEP